MRFPVTIEIRPSRRLRAALVFVHLLALGGLVATLPLRVCAAFMPLLAYSVWRSWGVVQGACLRLHADARIEWLFPDGQRLPGEVLADSTAFRWLVVLRIRLADERRVRALMVLADNVPPPDFRRLQIWMRWVLPFRQRADAG